jgi:hypothetical protein
VLGRHAGDPGSRPQEDHFVKGGDHEGWTPEEGSSREKGGGRTGGP